MSFVGRLLLTGLWVRMMVEGESGFLQFSVVFVCGGMSWIGSSLDWQWRWFGSEAVVFFQLIMLFINSLKISVSINLLTENSSNDVWVGFVRRSCLLDSIGGNLANRRSLFPFHCMLDFLMCWFYGQRVRFLRCRRIFSTDGRLRRLAYLIFFLRSFRKSGNTPCHRHFEARMHRPFLEAKRGFGAGSIARGQSSVLIYPSIDVLVSPNVVALILINVYEACMYGFVVLAFSSFPCNKVAYVARKAV